MSSSSSDPLVSPIFPVVFSTPDPAALAELAASHLFPIARYILAMGRIAELNTWYDGEQVTDDAQVDRWLAFLRQWIDHYDPL